MLLWTLFVPSIYQPRRPRASPLWQILTAAIELFRHRFLHALREGKHISPSRLADLLSWKHSGFNIHDGGEKPVPSHDTEGRKRLAEYLLRHPFPLQKPRQPFTGADWGFFLPKHR